MEQLSFQYPVWMLGVCLLAGLLFAGMLYWRDKKFDEQNKWLRPLLAFLRFGIVSTIGILLLGPMIKQTKEESKKPSVAILMDNSTSISSWLNGQSLDLPASFNTLKSQLEEKYDVATYSIGGEVALLEDSLSFDEPLTNLSEPLKYITDIYEGENLGAILLATDGIFNEGQNPLYTSINTTIPIYSIALGDTSQRRDLSIQNVLHNEVAYLSDQMSTQVDIKASNAQNQTVRLRVQKEVNGSYVTVADKNIRITGNDFFITQNIDLDLKDVGINHYRYSISTLSNEENRSNNRKDIYIEVLDARQNIGIIAQAPHPDIAALKQIIEQNKNYDVKVFYQAPNVTDLTGLDLVIFHNLPGGRNNLKNQLSVLDQRKTPRIYIIGGEANLTQFNQTQSQVSISGRGGSTSEAQADVASDFENFTLDETLKREIKNFPPLAAPFGEYKISANSKTLLYQSIGDIRTDFPLLAFNDEKGIKTTFLFGTDIWRWKLFDFLQNENFNLVSELIDKTIIYTSSKEDKRKFRVSTNNTVFNTTDDVIFQAELYNNSYELVNDPEVVLSLKNSEGTTFNYTFSKTDNAYMLDIGRLNAGAYSYSSSTSFNGQQFEDRGRFVVKEIQYELYDLQAQHSILYALANRSNGAVFFPENLSQLSNTLVTEKELKPVIYQSTISKPIMDLKWLFGILAFFLALEWMLRRYFGSL